MWFTVTNRAVARQFSTSTVAAIREFCEQRCGSFMTNSTFGFSPQRSELTACVEIGERYRLMTGMVAMLDISTKDIMFEFATAKRWSDEAARSAATYDIAKGTIAIYMQPNVASYPCGLDETDWPLVSEYPHAREATGSCIVLLPPHVLKYGAIYNQMIVDYLRAK